MKDDYQLPSGQLWWEARYIEEGCVRSTIFTYEGERNQTWWFAHQYAATQLGLKDAKVSLWEFS